MRVTRRSSLELLSLFGLAVASPGLAVAQEAHPAREGGKTHGAPDGDDPRPGEGAAKPSGKRRLPPDSTIAFTIEADGRTLPIKGTAGALTLASRSGEAQAEVATVAYQLDGADASTRPVAFVVNGGPGASSAWLHLGALGPWRLPMEGLVPSSKPALVDNAETWLPFADLVFIDPPETGYSRVTGGDGAKKRLLSVDGDIDGLAAAIRRWLVANGRLVSPKFFVGESYGGFRGPRVAKALATEAGVGLAGLVLISPVFDFGAFFGGRNGPFPSLTRLPSYAATLRATQGPVTRASLADVEAYATGEYLADWLKGPRDAAAVARIEARVAALTGLDPALVARLGGIVDGDDFTNESALAKGRVRASYDGTIEAYDPFPDSFARRALDPVLPGFEPAFASAMVDLYARKFGWKVEDRYELINEATNGAWDWGGRIHLPESLTALRQMLALDPGLRVLVAHGLTDVTTPYFGTKLELDQIPDYGAPGRLKLEVWPGGHMLYARDESRQALRDEGRRLIERT